MHIIETPVINTDNKIWNMLNKFLTKLNTIENLLQYNKRFFKTKNKYVCVKCNKQIKINKYFSGDYSWDSALYHIVSEHNYKPPTKFINYIFKYNVSHKTKVKKIVKFHSREYTMSNLKYIKITQNQLMIFDALLKHGGYEKKYKNHKRNKVEYRHSEHAGLLDFDNTGLERVIISGKTTRKDPDDETIFLPQSMDDAIDYEYIFHTHPPTPYPGGRACDGLLYEFPSISDMLHFIDHFNDGITQGSLVACAEGIYNIRKNTFDDKKIIIDEEKFVKLIGNENSKIQNSAINKHGCTFTPEYFYSAIAQDTHYIKKYNKALSKFKLQIDYFPRIKDVNNEWIYDDLYIPIFVIEPK